MLLMLLLLSYINRANFAERMRPWKLKIQTLEGVPVGAAAVGANGKPIAYQVYVTVMEVSSSQRNCIE
jgi:hypothetical protein